MTDTTAAETPRDAIAIAVTALEFAVGDTGLPSDSFARDQQAAFNAMELTGDALQTWADKLAISEVRAIITAAHRIADEHERRAGRARTLAHAVATYTHDAIEGQIHGPDTVQLANPR